MWDHETRLVEYYDYDNTSLRQYLILKTMTMTILNMTMTYLIVSIVTLINAYQATVNTKPI